MKEARTIVEQNKHLRHENLELTADNTYLKQRIASIDEMPSSSYVMRKMRILQHFRSNWNELMLIPTMLRISQAGNGSKPTEQRDKSRRYLTSPK